MRQITGMNLTSQRMHNTTASVWTGILHRTDIGDSEPYEYSESKKIQPYTSSYFEIIAFHTWWDDTISHCHSLNQESQYILYKVKDTHKRKRFKNKQQEISITATSEVHEDEAMNPFWRHWIVTITKFSIRLPFQWQDKLVLAFQCYHYYIPRGQGHNYWPHNAGVRLWEPKE